MQFLCKRPRITQNIVYIIRALFFGLKPVIIARVQDENVRMIAGASCKLKNISILYLLKIMKELEKRETLDNIIADLLNVCTMI